MKNTRTAKIALRVAVFYFTLAGFSQNIRAQSEMRLRLVHDTVVIVSLTANDQGPFDFILDTGTNSTVVDPSLANRLSLAALDHVEMATPSGIQTLFRTSLHTLTAGPVRVDDVEVLVQDLSALRSIDSHIQGIVGQNFLSRFNYLLDYRNRTLQVEEGSEIHDVTEGERVRLEVSDEKLLVASEARSGGLAKLRLLLDSGSNSVVLIHKASVGLNLAAQENARAVTGNGQMRMQVGRVRTLTVGTEKFHDLPVALPRAQDEDMQRVEDGILPTALFKTLYINNREGYVVFNPRLKKN